jgi:hypothetical protein
MICLLRAVFTQPGYLSEEYIKVFSLKSRLTGEFDADIEENGDPLQNDFQMFEIDEVEKMFDTFYYQSSESNVHL